MSSQHSDHPGGACLALPRAKLGGDGDAAIEANSPTPPPADAAASAAPAEDAPAAEAAAEAASPPAKGGRGGKGLNPIERIKSFVLD